MSYYYTLSFLKASQGNITQGTKNDGFKLPSLLVVQRFNYQGCFIFKQLSLGWLDKLVREENVSSQSCEFDFCMDQLNQYKETCSINSDFNINHAANYSANMGGYSQEVYT